MNKSVIFILPLCLALSNCASFSSSTANTPQQFVVNGYQVETMASQYAYPRNIHVKPLENSLQITGQVTHHIHQAIRIRGYVNVELLDANDQIVKRVTVPLQRQSGRPNRGHNPAFSVLISDIGSNKYRLRIRHSIGTFNHQ